ncbi:hypothetical protein H6P81_009593 [Aristolochia fimbriata]|uniref:Reverse transcriptase domain-containing protein n=1 Tax=Aristolochia fimbriata TaxID=158543 RepID=A0AAV7EQS9_ARIFI|nr:hypothetical protein H6P81_009593 [Aristolochia fimbriata]
MTKTPRHIEGTIVSHQSPVMFYSDLYKDDGFARPFPRNLSFKQLSEHSVAPLIEPFSEEEIETAVKGLPTDRAPGPDGFTASFYKTCWDFLKEDVLLLFQEFHNEGLKAKSMGASLIALVPKKEGAAQPSDFRPISLISSHYKLISRVLTTRLRRVMSEIISPNQSAFIKGRQILDFALVIHELLHYYRKERKQGTILKIDLEKAFDKVNWAFLDDVMVRMGFPTKWRTWIQGCISSPKFSILINGTPKGYFTSSRGLRQGDPISPLLFNMVSEVLCVLLYKCQEEESFSGFNIRNQLKVPILQFADDTLILCDGVGERMIDVKAILYIFEMISGQKINWEKSGVMGVNRACEIEIASYRKATKKVRHMERSASVTSRESNIVKVYSSRYSKLLLITVAMPDECCSKDRVYTKKFPLAGSQNLFKYPLVKWRKVCRPTKQGGLGIKSVKFMNVALLAKWIWRYTMEEGSMWKTVIAAKYGDNSVSWLPIQRPNRVSTLWRSIMTEKDIMTRHIRHHVRDGVRTFFWTDCWIGSNPLCTSYPRLYALSNEPNMLVSNAIMTEGRTWNLRLRRNLNDAETTEIADMMLKLESMYFSQRGHDEIIWSPCVSGVFSVSSYYKLLSNSGQQHQSPPECNSMDLPAPKKVQHFIWTAAQHKILTYDQLTRRGQMVVDDLCKLCGSQGETANHLLIHCSFAKAIWSAIMQKFGISFCMPKDFRSLLQQWSICPLRTIGTILWKATMAAIPWNLWLERNTQIFEGKERPVVQIIDKCIQCIVTWAFNTNKMPKLPYTILVKHWDKVIKFSIPKIVAMVVSEPPPSGWYALNFDGSSLGNPGPAGIGGTLSDSTGQHIMFYSGPAGIATCNEAESQALLTRLKLFNQLFQGPLQVQGDSALAISWAKGAPPPWKLKRVYDEIHDLMQGQQLDWTHIPRSANSMADRLAREGTQRPNLTSANSLPLF